MDFVNWSLFWRAAVVQAALVGALFAVLALTLPHSFFEDWGYLVGPLAWLGCSIAPGAILKLPLSPTAISAVVSGAAAGLIGIAVSHAVSLPVAVGVFAAACARRQMSTPSSRSHSATGSGTSSP